MLVVNLYQNVNVSGLMWIKAVIQTRAAGHDTDEEWQQDANPWEDTNGWLEINGFWDGGNGSACVKPVGDSESMLVVSPSFAELEERVGAKLHE